MASARAISAEQRAQEHGVQQVSQTLFNRVTSYHAQIGHNVNRETLQSLEWQLLSEAKALFHRKEYEESLNTFTHCLAVTEKTRSSKDATVRGAIVHNIASCLHHLGELEAAQAYYEQAIQAFEKAKTPMIERMMYGDTNRRRVDFVKERLIDISWGRKPDGDKYLDENGHKRPVPLQPLAYERRPAAGLTPKWATEEPPPPPWALADEEAAAKDYPYARRPAWMSSVQPEEPPEPQEQPMKRGMQRVHQREEDAYFVDQRMTTGGVADAEMDDALQERARKEWLQYHLQTANWAAAEELVVTADEREDLEYLVERERRLGAEAGRAEDGAACAHEDFSNLNEAAEAAMKQDARQSRPPPASKGSRPPEPIDDDDDDML